jgi:hypothetical protein
LKGSHCRRCDSANEEIAAIDAELIHEASISLMEAGLEQCFDGVQLPLR